MSTLTADTPALSDAQTREFIAWLPRLGKTLADSAPLCSVEPRVEASCVGLIVRALRDPDVARYPHSLMLYVTWSAPAVAAFLADPYRHAYGFYERAADVIAALERQGEADIKGGSQHSAHTRTAVLDSF